MPTYRLTLATSYSCTDEFSVDTFYGFDGYFAARERIRAIAPGYPARLYLKGECIVAVLTGPGNS